MEIYNNEDEQVDAIKRFFAENGKIIKANLHHIKLFSLNIQTVNQF